MRSQHAAVANFFTEKIGFYLQWSNVIVISVGSRSQAVHILSFIVIVFCILVIFYSSCSGVPTKRTQPPHEHEIKKDTEIKQIEVTKI